MAHDWPAAGSMTVPGRRNWPAAVSAKLPCQILTRRSGPARAGSENRSARCYLDACCAARVERNQPVAVGAAEDPGFLPQYPDDLLDHLILIDLVGILVGQVRVLASEEPTTEHDNCHAETAAPVASPATGGDRRVVRRKG